MLSASTFGPSGVSFLMRVMLHVLSSLSQEVNLSNNELGELPPLWEATWGRAHPSTGLLALPSPAAPAKAQEGQEGQESKGAKGTTVRVLLLGNPLMTAVAAVGQE